MLRTDLRERVGDAVALDVGVGGDLGEGRHRAADCEERRGRAREPEAQPRERQVRGGAVRARGGDAAQGRRAVVEEAQGPAARVRRQGHEGRRAGSVDSASSRSASRNASTRPPCRRRRAQRSPPRSAWRCTRTWPQVRSGGSRGTGRGARRGSDGSAMVSLHYPPLASRCAPRRARARCCGSATLLTKPAAGTSSAEAPTGARFAAHRRLADCIADA